MSNLLLPSNISHTENMLEVLLITGSNGRTLNIVELGQSSTVRESELDKPVLDLFAVPSEDRRDLLLLESKTVQETSFTIIDELVGQPRDSDSFDIFESSFVIHLNPE